VARVAAAESRLGKAAAAIGDRRIGPGSARAREPRRLEVEVGENTGKGKAGRGTQTIEINRRPYSSDWTTRLLQKKVLDPLADRAIARADARPDSLAAKVYGTRARYGRRAGRAGRDLARETEMEASRRVRREVKKYREHTKGMSREMQAALDMHLRGQLDVPGVAPTVARDNVVRMMREGNERLVSETGARNKNSLKIIEAHENVPAEWLDLNTAPPQLRAAVEEGRRLGELATQKRVAAKTIKPEQAAARSRRSAEMAQGGSRFDPKRVDETPEVLAARQGLAEAIRARAEGPRRVRPAQYFSAGRRTGRGDRNLELARPIPTTPRRQPAIAGTPNARLVSAKRGTADVEVIPGSTGSRQLGGRKRAETIGDRAVVNLARPGQPGDWAVVRLRDLPEVDGVRQVRWDRDSGRFPGVEQRFRTRKEAMAHIEAKPTKALPRTGAIQRPKGISASQSRAYRQILRGRGRQVELKSAAKQAEQASRRVREARKKLTKVEKRNRGSFTPPDREGLGANAVYREDIAVDQRAGRSSKGASGKDYNRLTQERDRQNQGRIYSTGRASIDPELTVRALERAVKDELHPQMVEQFKQAFAAKRPDGSFVTGRDALKGEIDPDKFALVSVKSFDEARKRLDALPEGEMPKNPLDGLDVYEGAAGIEKAKALKGKQRDQLIAVSKDALEGLREGWSSMGPRNSLGKGYDTGLSLWKRGMLPFAPRWYINNLFGNTLIYGILTGGDLRSFRQASMRRAGEAVPERVAGGLVEQTRIEYGSNFGKREAGRVRRGFERGSEWGFAANHFMESFIRRAAYLNRMKKGLRHEGLATRAQIRKMSDQELIDAIDNAPREVKEQALREVELFLGDFVRMNPFEQRVLRRIFPWYSWMRVIGRLSLGLPLRHPLRASVAALVARATNEATNPDDFMREIYNRGRIGIGPVSLRTSSLNPFSTHLEAVDNLLGGDSSGFVGNISGDLSPAVAPILQKLTGRDPFGRPFSAPPGYGGTVQAYGQDPMAIDPATDLPESRINAPGWAELFFRQLPLVPAVARAAASQGRDPYDTTGIMDLLTGSKPKDQLFWPKSNRETAFENILPGGLQQLLNLVVPLQRHNPEAEARQYRDRMKRLRDAERQTRRRKAKAAARER
jgi:hypothetical protein